VTIGAAGPKVVRPDGDVEFVCARRLPTLRASLLEALGLHNPLRGTPLDPYGYSTESYLREHDVECLSGAAMLVRANALHAAGGVDDRWFMYFEDIDICARLARAGWRLRYCPQAVATHIGAGSSPRSEQLSVWLAVHLQGAVNVFFTLHRGPLVAHLHRLLIGVGGTTRIAAGGVSLLRSRRAAARWWFALGTALLRWSISLRIPPGDPRAPVAAQPLEKS
jgi:GT2 family glycosyltransferase